MYDYKEEKLKIFTEDGQKTFLEVRDRVKQLLKYKSEITMEDAIRGICGSSWFHMACVDRLVELKELRETTKGFVVGQHRVFVSSS